MNIEETIERIKRKITIGVCEKDIGIPVYISDLKAVLEELENKQDDINILQAQRDSMEYQFKQAKAELEKKDRIIKEMVRIDPHIYRVANIRLEEREGK